MYSGVVCPKQSPCNLLYVQTGAIVVVDVVVLVPGPAVVVVVVVGPAVVVVVVVGAEVVVLLVDVEVDVEVLVVVVLSPGPNVVVEVVLVLVVDVVVVVGPGVTAVKLNEQSTGGIYSIFKVSSNIGPNNCKLHSPLAVL
jgi:hypothetical protein